MNAPRQMHDLGQSLWLGNITQGILDDGTLQRYISDLQRYISTSATCR